MYEKRLVDELLSEYMSILPAVLVEGAKAVGKTESCKKISKTLIDLDDPQQREIATLAPKTVLDNQKPILLDEWQKAPNLWSFVRHQIDDGLEDGSIIFTGSSLKVHTDLHSGAGRIPKLKMRPFSIEERNMAERYIRVSEMFNSNFEFEVGLKTNNTISEYIEEIYDSGFPGIRKRSTRAREILLRGYVDELIHKEFEENGFIIKKPYSLLAWLKGYAASIATPTATQTISEVANSYSNEEMARTTVNVYKNALQTLNIIEELPAWIPFGRTMPNLRKSEEHFLIDPAIATYLLDVPKEQIANYKIPTKVAKFTTTFLGQLFESFVYQSLITYAELNNAHLSYLRTQKGDREIDFIIQKGSKILLFEVKVSDVITDEDVKHLNWFEGEFGDEFEVVKNVIYAGQYSLKRSDNVNLIPASLLGC
jgi:predicted AAA+ superfamily ATPase